MLYKLYTYEKGLKMIDAASEEYCIIDTISEYIKRNNNIEFIIVLNDGNGDIPYKTINNLQQYVDYLEEMKQKYGENVKRTVK